MVDERKKPTLGEPLQGAAVVQEASLIVGDDDKGDEDTESLDEKLEAAAKTSRPLIFISYRHGSDQPVASALKLLLERAIDPAPEVFVASEGGIRPSQYSWKEQLLAAVQRAAAFIGVFTQASKEREWLFFEAGAAWGLGKLYAPFLVDTSAYDLGTTIADLQTTNAYNADQVHQLFETISSNIGARLRGRFGPKHASFLRQLRSHEPPKTSDEENTIVPRAKVQEVVVLLLSQNNAEADTLIRELESSATSIHIKVKIRVWIITEWKKTPQERLDEIEQLPHEYHSSPWYEYWKGVWELNSDLAISHLRNVIANTNSDELLVRMATISLASRLYSIKQDLEATELLLTSLGSTDRELRCEAAIRWCQHRPVDPPLLRLMVAGLGHRSQPSLDLLMQAIKISLDEAWLSLGIYYANSVYAMSRTGTTANEKGRAYAKASLFSLAHDAFTEAATLGASVARCNIASNVGRNPIPAIGIQTLDQHQGAFDSESPDFPFQIRATLEQAIHFERERRDKLAHTGELLDTLLVDLLERAIRMRAKTPQSSYMLNGQQYAATQKGDDLVLTPNTPVAQIRSNTSPVVESSQEEVKLTLQRLWQGLPLWEATLSGRRHLMALDDKGCLVGLSLTTLSSETPEPRPVKLDATDLSPANGSRSGPA